MVTVYLIYCYHSYLREVGFPDNVLEARVARLNLYRTLINGSSVQNELPPPPPPPLSVGGGNVEGVSLLTKLGLYIHVWH